MTAFVIFIVMASRRLSVNPDFTTNWNPQTYTEEGLKWVGATESLRDLLQREFTLHICSSFVSFFLTNNPDFTTNWNPQTYTEEGLKWVGATESLRDLLQREFTLHIC